MAEKKSNKNTIIIIVIVSIVAFIAIIGAIFLPRLLDNANEALSRSQRNTQRRDDYSMLVAEVNSYMSNNNGKIANLINNGDPTDLVASRWINNDGRDPEGNRYELKVYSYDKWQSDGSKAPNISRTTGGSQVFVIIQANCNGTDSNGDSLPLFDTAKRSFAVYGYLEGGAVFCQSSGSSR